MQIPSRFPEHNSPPFFSILILCWNSNAYIRKCLEALRAQSFTNFEIILVDNGSPEPVSREQLDAFSDLAIRFFPIKDNLGFAAGNNFAAKKADGAYLVLLNSDAFPEPGWLDEIFHAIERHPGCSFASQLIMAETPRYLDGEGDNYHASGLVWRRSYGAPVAGAGKTEREVFSACGAAAIYPKEAYDRVGGFDEDYFAYVEDIDLGFRLRLIGCPCIYLPSAVVYHVGSGSTSRRSDFSVYYGQRNLVWTFFKDMPGILFWLLIPFHLLANLLMIFLSLLRRQGRVTLRAKRDACAGLGKILRKRNEVQRRRRVSVGAILKAIDWNPFSPFTKLLRKRLS